MPEGVFLYFINGKNYEDIKPADLAANPILAGPFFDLIHSPRMFKDHRIGCTVTRGPEGMAGCVVSIQPQCAINLNMPHYNPATQTWRKFGEQWIGWQTDMLPGPESLRRPTQLQGYEVELGDGKVWIAPVIRAFQESSGLWQSRIAMTWGVNEDMSPKMEPLERYREIWEVSGKVFAAVCAGASPPTFAECYEWATRCLGMNYRIGAVEASLLGIFTDDTIRLVMESAVDIPLVEAAEKKAGETQNPT